MWNSFELGSSVNKKELKISEKSSNHPKISPSQESSPAAYVSENEGKKTNSNVDVRTQNSVTNSQTLLFTSEQDAPKMRPAPLERTAEEYRPPIIRPVRRPHPIVAIAGGRRELIERTGTYFPGQPTTGYSQLSRPRQAVKHCIEYAAKLEDELFASRKELENLKQLCDEVD